MKKIITILAIALCVYNIHAQMFWNQAAKFENGSYIAGPNTLSLNIVGSLTIEAWVYPTVSSGIRYIVFKGNASNGYYLRLNSNGTVSLGTNGLNRITSTAVIPAGKWSHVAGSYDVSSNGYKLFVNGLEDASIINIINSAPNTNTDSLLIGKFGGNTFTGLMDEVRIWTKAVSPTMIRRSFRTSLTISNGQYVSLLFSMPFQRINSSGTSFTIQDLSLNPISVNPTYSRGVTAVDLSSRPSDYLSGNESLVFEGNNDSYAELATNTLNSLTGAMTSFLTKGSLWSRVKKLIGGGKFEVSTHGMGVGVRGTEFTVEVIEENGVNYTVTKVFEGSVEVNLKSVDTKDYEEKLDKQAELTEEWQAGKITMEEYTARSIELANVLMDESKKLKVSQLVEAGYFLRTDGKSLGDPVPFNTSEDTWFIINE